MSVILEYAESGIVKSAWQLNLDQVDGFAVPRFTHARIQTGYVDR